MNDQAWGDRLDYDNICYISIKCMIKVSSRERTYKKYKMFVSVRERMHENIEEHIYLCIYNEWWEKGIAFGNNWRRVWLWLVVRGTLTHWGGSLFLCVNLSVFSLTHIFFTIKLSNRTMGPTLNNSFLSHSHFSFPIFWWDLRCLYI